MITIGVDPGIERTGIGIVEVINNKMKLIDSLLIKTSSKLSTPERLLEIYETLEHIVNLYPIDNAAVERLFFAKNIKTALTVSEARGVMLLVLQKNKVPISEYTPLQVKQALIGYGRATKKQVQELVKIILNMEKIEKQDDVADGIALAITHINTHKTLQRIKKFT